jgi:hypothetical protein
MRHGIKGDITQVLENLRDLDGVKNDATKKTQVETILKSIEGTTLADCHTGLSKIQMGITCLIASAKASDFVTAAADKVTVRINMAKAGTEL